MAEKLDPHDQLPQISRAHCGVFTTGQALAAGIHHGIIKGNQRSGRWIKVLGRGWVSATQPVGILQRCWAAMLTYPDSVIIGISAMAAWHALQPKLFYDLPETDTTIWLATSNARQASTGIRFRQIAVPVCQSRPSRGLRLADPSDSVIDALAMLPVAQADALFAWLVSRRRLEPTQLEAGIERYRTRTGVPALRKYRRWLATGAASELELRLHMLLIRAGIRGWVANAPIRAAGRIVASVDMLFEKQKLIVEADGFSAHGSSAALRKDRQRFRDLQAAGYRVLPFTWRDIAEYGQQTIDAIKQALSQGTREQRMVRRRAR
jgi:hypothetical protein